MPDTISATGVVGTPPALAIVGDGLARLTFRLGSTQRKFNREASGWENGETNWYTVVAFRRLAEHGSQSLNKGDRVVVSGRLRVNEWEKDGRHGTTVQLIADAIGHDLTFGTSTLAKAASGPARTGPDETAGGSTPERTERGAVDADGWAVPGGSAPGARPQLARDTDGGALEQAPNDAEVRHLETAVEPPF
ncbi:MAG TPA: single-stranded DNA-binding protein [Lacisediminihabitans sp.]|uniref:single-stranded DNA-binding protein n=1 Tax=Lacisediminihabitans sp. TaxID=2787631 RepID=UPI002ED9F802